MFRIFSTTETRFKQCLLAGLSLVIGFSGATSKADMNIETSSGKPLRVLINGNGLPVFSDDSGVQGLETVLEAVLGQLVYSTGSFDLKPGLLSAFHWEFDKSRYVLELRDGLRFQNGRKATAEDLEFSIVRGLLSKKASWFRPFFANVAGIKAADGKHEFKSGMIPGIQVLDQHRVAIKLDAPNPSFLHSLARSYFSLVPREELESDFLTWKRYPVGAGNFKIMSISPDRSRIEMENVAPAAGGPSRVSLSSIGSPDQFDLAISAPVEGSSLVTKATGTATSVTGIYFNFDNEFGKQIHFRRAVAAVLDRAVLVAGVPAYTENSELLASQFWGRSGEKPLRDLTLARAEVKKMKPKVSAKVFRIPVFNSDFGNGVFGRYIEVLSKQLAEAGIQVEFYKSEKKFFDASDRATPFRIISLGADVVDPLVLFGLFRNGSPMAPHFPKDDHKFEGLYLKAAAAPSLDSKALAVKELSKYFVAEEYAVPLFERHGIVAINPRKIRDLGQQGNTLAVHLNEVVLK